MYTCMCVCIYIQKCICPYIHMCIYIYVYFPSCFNIYAHLYIYIHTFCLIPPTLETAQAWNGCWPWQLLRAISVRLQKMRSHLQMKHQNRSANFVRIEEARGSIAYESNNFAASYMSIKINWQIVRLQHIMQNLMPAPPLHATQSCQVEPKGKWDKSSSRSHHNGC